jgi:hypothetical protein
MQELLVLPLVMRPCLQILQVTLFIRNYACLVPMWILQITVFCSGWLLVLLQSLLRPVPSLLSVFDFS